MQSERREEGADRVRSQTLGSRPYQRITRRRGYANGFKSKTVWTRIGALHLAVSKTRGMEF